MPKTNARPPRAIRVVIASHRSPPATRAVIGAQRTHPRPASTHPLPAALHPPSSFPACRVLPTARTLLASPTAHKPHVHAARRALHAQVAQKPLAVARCTLPAARCMRRPRTTRRICLVQVPPPATRRPLRARARYVPQGVVRTPTRPRRDQLWPQQVPETLRFGRVNRRPSPTTSWSPPATRRGSPPAARFPPPHRPARSSACPTLPGTRLARNSLPPGTVRCRPAIAAPVARCVLLATCYLLPAVTCRSPPHPLLAERRLPLVARRLLPVSSDTFPVPPRCCLLHALITQSPPRACASTRTYSLDARTLDSIRGGGSDRGN
ncbi:hypothetical protein GGX14DRAFT_579052 [Mycena pura]|uniref:Uncharacterized protein n=1 Tax=Mycena pura TaxID=153505 RepID=A0AAD6XXB4_9AGAR|nr:hypothetical protein GGX14DRAFT_579052 [Mycena pura]